MLVGRVTSLLKYAFVGFSLLGSTSLMAGPITGDSATVVSDFNERIACVFAVAHGGSGCGPAFFYVGLQEATSWDVFKFQETDLGAISFVSVQDIVGTAVPTFADGSFSYQPEPLDGSSVTFAHVGFGRLATVSVSSEVATSVPEPGTLALVGASVAVFGGSSRRRKVRLTAAQIESSERS